MRKIKVDHNPNDRILCKNIKDGNALFYVQSKNSKKEIWLFNTKSFSGSLYGYFQKKGRLEKDGYSMTISQLHQFHKYENKKLTHVVELIPSYIEYAVKYLLDDADDYIDTYAS